MGMRERLAKLEKRRGPALVCVPMTDDQGKVWVRIETRDRNGDPGFSVHLPDNGREGGGSGGTGGQTGEQTGEQIERCGGNL